MEKINRSKGQMFLIATIFILISFFLLRNVLDIYNVFEEKRTQETKTEDLQMSNAVKEFAYAAGIASMQDDVNGTARDYLFNFSSFIRNTRDAEILYMLAYSNSSTGKYWVVVGNFLNDNINATMSATNSNPVSYQFLLGDRRNFTAEFNFTSNGTLVLNLTYRTRNEDRRDLVNITVQSPRHFLALMTDITLKGNDISVRYKDIYNRSWKVPQ
jgi:hypothetical protein